MNGKTAVCVGSPEDAKRAALYFEHIVHIWNGIGVAPRHPFWPEPIRSNHDASAELSILSHNHALVGASSVEEVFEVKHARNPGVEHIKVLFPKNDGSTHIRLEENYLNNTEGVLDDVADFLSRHGVMESVFVASSGKAFMRPDKGAPDPAVVISGLKIVDTSKSNWDQIAEFRKDDESTRKLRRFTIFTDDNLKGKSRSYIENRIQVELEDYEEACSKHGFDLVTGTLTKVIDSKNIAAASGMTAVALLAGLPIAAIIGAPLLLELAHISISVSSNLYSLGQTKKLHPMSYIVQAKEAFQS